MVLKSASREALRSAGFLNMLAADGAKPYLRGATAAISMSPSNPAASITPLILLSASVKHRNKWKYRALYSGEAMEEVAARRNSVKSSGEEVWIRDSMPTPDFQGATPPETFA